MSKAPGMLRTPVPPEPSSSRRKGERSSYRRKRQFVTAKGTHVVHASRISYPGSPDTETDSDDPDAIFAYNVINDATTAVATTEITLIGTIATTSNAASLNTITTANIVL